jgi:[methyl-Co(III) methanol-specific corrinoid protein]:coenzyme M methyltransferase
MANHFQQQCATSTIVHICGNIKSTGRIIAQLSAEVISVDSVVALHTLKELVGSTKATMGNVSTFTLEKGTPEKVGRATELCLSQSVDILAPACGISPRTPLQNIRSMTEAVKNRRQPTPKSVN